MAFAHRRAFARPALFSSMALALLVGTAAPVAAAASETKRVVSVAKNQIGDPWVWGTIGPDKFDCVGFVYYSFRQAGLADRIGGYRGVKAYRDWFADRGRVSRSNGRRGDLVIWGNNQHIGIYLGRGRAISALTSGVKIHALHGLTISFNTFLRVRLKRG